MEQQQYLPILIQAVEMGQRGGQLGTLLWKL
jgi:hypothetical protein